MSVGIVNYGAGNVRSLLFALGRLDVGAFVSDDPDRLATADRLILPGVGAAAAAMAQLRERGLDSMIRSYERPLLGICLGMQLLCQSSAEGDARCLGIIPVRIDRFQGGRKVPHTGWNTLERCRGALFQGLNDGSFVYYVHSYRAEPGSYTIAETSYIGAFSAALQQDNFYGVQFHPEKSGFAGGIILKNFLSL